MKCTIYDYETLGLNPLTCPVLSIAAVQFDQSRFIDNPYSYEELLKNAKTLKFDVSEQVETYGKIIEKGTLKWWSEQDKEVRDSQLKSSSKDVSITEVHAFLLKACDGAKFVYARGNTFDPIITEQLLRDTGKGEAYPWWVVRDTRSMIEGMSYGSGLKNSFMPEGLEDKFKAHDPVHDIAMDVMRLQSLAQAIL